MEFFKKRSTAWAVLAIVIVCSFFIGQARQPADEIEILPSGVYVQDNAGILSSSTEELITQLNNGLVSQVGAEIQVVTINTTGGQDIFDTAVDHGVATNLSANSCVFLIAADDTDAVIVQGQALVSAFSDDQLSYILQQNFTLQDFRSRDLDAPVKNSFMDLVHMYENYYGIAVKGSSYVESVQPSGGVSMSGEMIAVIVFVLLILLLVLIVSRPRRRTVVTRTVPAGRTVVPPAGNYPPRGTYTTPPRYSGRNTTSNTSSSRSGGFGSSSRGGSFSSGSRSSSRTSFGSSSRSGGFGGGSRGGSFRSGGGSRGGGFRK